MFLHKLFVIISKISTHCHTMFYLNVVHFLEWIKIQILIFFTITDPLGQSFTTLVVYLCFFITQPPYKITLSWRHIACSSLWGTRERFTCWTRVPYLWLKKKGEEGKSSIGPKMKYGHAKTTCLILGYNKPRREMSTQWEYRDNIFVKRRAPTVCFVHRGIRIIISYKLTINVSVTYLEYLKYPVNNTKGEQK